MECNYCERFCEIPEENSGYCKMYRNVNGQILENYPDAYLNVYPVSSESIPLLHFHPNSIFLLISTIGCNFACGGCISEFQTIRKGTLQEVLTHYTPEEILALARESNCRGITFCLNEPTVSLPTFLRVAKAAKKEGFLVGCSSNGYMSRYTFECLIPFLDFVNIGLKGSSEERYKECGIESGVPVFRNLRNLYNAGVSVEVSVMYLKDREDEVFGAAEIISEISKDIPLQVMRFMDFNNNFHGQEPSREEGEELCNKLRSILDHVYLFNTPATTELDSRCPVCGNIIFHRVFFGPMAARVLSCMPDGVCTCGYKIPYKGEIMPIPEEEPKVLGGYRSIMGMKFIIKYLNILGVTDDLEINKLCNSVIANGYMDYLQNQKDNFQTFFELLSYLAKLANREEEAGHIKDYVRSVISDIEEKVINVNKPRVISVFCHPLSPLYATKFGNVLVETAGGISLNIEQDFKESANAEYNVESFNKLNPEVIMIDGHFAPPLDEFLKTCEGLGIRCRAISEGRVYIMSKEYATQTLGWVIGLMETANLLHPEIFRYSLEEEKIKQNRVINQTPGILL